MDQRILDMLRNAPSLDLYELSLTVNRLLADPVRLLEICKLLHLGARVKFFHRQTNALAAGTVVELRQKECSFGWTVHTASGGCPIRPSPQI